MGYRAVLALNKKEDLNRAAKAFEKAEIREVTRATDTMELILACTSRQTDILMVDMELPFMDCMNAVEYLVENEKVKLVLAVADDWEHYLKEQELSGIDIFVSRPIDEAKVVPGLLVNLARKERLRQLEEEYEREEQAFQREKMLRYTVHLLMDKLDCTEEESLRHLQKSANAYGKDIYGVAEIFYSMLCMEKKRSGKLKDGRSKT